LKQRLVVVGNGMAGGRFVEELCARGGAGRYEICVFGAEPRGSYNRILLSGVLAKEGDAAAIELSPVGWYAANGVRLHAGVKAERIDLVARKVHGAGGVLEPYDKLVIATGSRPLVPPLAGLKCNTGAPKPGVFVFRTIDDCDAIAAYAARSRKAAVIGGGLLGLEAARGLLAHGLEVHVVHLMKHLMEMQLDARGGQVLQKRLEALGLRFHLEKDTRAVLGFDRATGLQFADGSTLDCDLVVVSAGIRPEVDLAREAGVLVERGVVVGDDLQTTHEGVFSIGECAQHRGRTYGLVAPCWEQAQVLADRLSGKRPQATYAGSRVSTKLKVMGVDLAVMGTRDALSEQDGEVELFDKKRLVYKKLVVRAGKLAGAILLGDTAANPRLLQAFDRGSELPEDPAEILFAGVEAKAQSVTALPDDARVCSCNGVSKGQILEAARGGSTVEAVCSRTRAGTGCGTCKRDVKALVEQAAAEAPARAAAAPIPAGVA
jgi:nitrite reductase (NADH) large subunit